MLLLGCAVGAVAHAQDRVPPGMVARFDIEQRLEYSDNPDLAAQGQSDFFGRTTLGFGLESVRRIDSFSLDLGVDIEEGRRGQPTVDVTNYFGNLNYTRETRNERLAFDLNYREADVTSNVTDEEFDADGDVISQVGGSRKRYGFGLEGAVGREAPIGASFRLGYNKIEYSGTTSTSQLDSDRLGFNGQLDFNITPRITASLTTNYEDLDVDGGVDRKTTGFGTSWRFVVSPVDTVNASLSYQTIERSGTQTGTDEGLSGSIDWTRALTNGSVGLSYASNVSSNNTGRRSFLNFNRTLELPRGALALTLGTTGTGAIGSDPLVQVDYTHNLPRGQIALGLSQSVNRDNTNNEEINTRLSASYNQQINDVSSFGLRMSLFNRNELQANPNDGQRIDLSVTYTHALTEDWGLVSGFTHRTSSEDNGADRKSNTVFVGLDRNFTWSP